VRVQREQLEHEGDVALGGAERGHVLAVEQNAPGGRHLKPGNHTQRRGLAAARRAEQDEELTMRDREVGVADRDELVEALLDVLEADLRHHSSGK
jgi:hypothetical protein